MNQVAAVVRDLGKAPQQGDIFQLGENEYITIASVGAGEVRYAPGVVDLKIFCDAPDDLLRTTLAMPYKTFRKWLATIAAGRRMDTPPPA